jgi:minor fimbrial subunit
MMKLKPSVKLAYGSVILLVTYSMGLNAADVSTINITGNVIASPCVVDSSNSVINVDLQQIQATTLATAGTGSDWKSFQIVLRDCPASTSKVQATFAGTQDGADAERYKNQGTATNLSIELTGSDGMNYGNGKTATVDVNSGSQTATFSLRTRAYTASGGVTPGSINASVVASFTYN